MMLMSCKDEVIWEHLNQLMGCKAKETYLPNTLNCNEINKILYKSESVNC